MRAQRERRRPALELLRADSPAPEAVTERLVVIQNASISATIRFVVLGGDPEAPQRQRPGIATIELFDGSWTDDEKLEIIEYFRAKAETKWAATVEREARVHRAMLELVRSEDLSEACTHTRRRRSSVRS